MKFYVLSRWTLTGKHFVHQVFASFDTAAEAKAHGIAQAKRYGDQEYVAVIKAPTYDRALDIAAKKGFI
jgi:hypothetical protein